MHIMEGYLPIAWCIFWFLLSLPIVYIGSKRIVKLTKDNPEQKMTVALSGAFIFLLSSMKLPSVTGSSSHPTGTGLSAVLVGVTCTAVLATIVLVFQALLLAHGGLTTLGANIFAMGIVGPAAAFMVWRHLRTRTGVSIPLAVFIAAAIANLVTYIIAALQLTLAFGAGQYMDAFVNFMTVFAVTQIPLAIIEGILLAMFANYLLSVRPYIFGLDENGDALKEAV